VLASHLEGYGMVVAEAVAHGLPVVAAAAGAVPDTLPPGAGRLVRPGDADALAVTIGELCDDRDALAALTAGARRASAAIPTWTEAVERFAAALGNGG
jgi:glycosyltransferase involved in cell wall biosynthesis